MDRLAGTTCFNARWPRFFFRCVLLKPSYAVKNNFDFEIDLSPGITILLLNVAFIRLSFPLDSVYSDLALSLAQTRNQIT